MANAATGAVLRDDLLVQLSRAVFS